MSLEASQTHYKRLVRLQQLVRRSKMPDRTKRELNDRLDDIINQYCAECFLGYHKDMFYHIHQN